MVWWCVGALAAPAVPDGELPPNDRPEQLVRPLTPPYEVSAFGGMLVNDPFLRPWVFGGAVTVRPNPILGVEFSAFGSPNRREDDYKPSAKRILADNAVTPDISRVRFAAGGALKFTPVYGVLLAGRRAPIAVDLSAVIGTGVVGTRDDLEALDKTSDPDARATESQLHPTLQLGVIGRVLLGPTVGWTVDARMLQYIEVIEADTLEMKQNVTVTTGISVGGRRR